MCSFNEIPDDEHDGIMVALPDYPMIHSEAESLVSMALMSEPGLFGVVRSPVHDFEEGEAPYGHAELCMSHRGRPLRWLRTIRSLVRDHEVGCQKGCPFVKFDCGNDFTVPAMGAIKQPEFVGRHEETGRIRSSKSESRYSFCCDKFVASRMRASRVRSCPTYKSAVSRLARQMPISHNRN